MFLGSIICCIIGYVYSQKFITSINNTSCSLFNFYEDAISGQKTDKLPRWIGIDGIASVLTNTGQALLQIQNSYPNAFNNNSWTQTDTENFIQSLNNSYNEFSSINFSNPNPANSQNEGKSTLTPLYISNYGPYSTNGTFLNLIYSEYNIMIGIAANNLIRAQNSSSIIISKINEINSTLMGIENNITSLENSFSKINNTILDQWTNIQNGINNQGILAFKILFGIYLFLAISGLFSIIFYSFCKCGFFKLFLHLNWIIGTILVFFTFILGSIFGIAGVASTDGPLVIQWIFSKQNLEHDHYVLADAQSTSYINICINGIYSNII